MADNQNSESSRIYSLFYSFFLIPLMMVVFGILFYLLFSVLTDEPTDINQLLLKLETGSVRDKANASYRINKLFADYPDTYSESYRERIIRIHNMSKSEFNLDPTLRLHLIMIMGNSKDSTFGMNLIDELSYDDVGVRVKAIESLGKLRYSQSAEIVADFLSQNKSFHEKLAAAGALGNIGNKVVLEKLLNLINSWPHDWSASDGPELRWESTLALLKLGYSDSNTNQIIENLLNRSYYNQYRQLDENEINSVLSKILHILYSIEDISLLQPFKNTIYNLSDNDPNLQIKNFAKKLFSRFK